MCEDLDIFWGYSFLISRGKEYVRFSHSGASLHAEKETVADAVTSF